MAEETTGIHRRETEAAGDNDVATDDYYRIQAIMQDCKTTYSLSWQDGGASEQLHLCP